MEIMKIFRIGSSVCRLLNSAPSRIFRVTQSSGAARTSQDRCKGSKSGLVGSKRRRKTIMKEDRDMAEITIVYWRDIPAQIIAGRGRSALKRALPERFEQAIDRCAMKIGARDAESYMAEWRKGAPISRPEDAEQAVAAELERVLNTYDPPRLAALIANDGWTTAPDPEEPEQP